MSVWAPRVDAQKSGVTPESVKAAAKASGMTLEEAQKILGVDRSASLQEVLKVSDCCTLQRFHGACPDCGG